MPENFSWRAHLLLPLQWGDSLGRKSQPLERRQFSGGRAPSDEMVRMRDQFTCRVSLFGGGSDLLRGQ